MRLVFKTKDELLAWIKECVSPERYVAYITDDNEVVLCPTRSTRPIIYGYLKVETNIGDIVKSIVHEFGIRCFPVKNVEWADDRPPGVKFIME